MRIAAVLLAWAFAPQMGGQTPEVRIWGGPYAPPSTVISVQSNLVEMTATVHGGDGRLAGGLPRDDFELLDDGKPRPIVYFSEQRAGREFTANVPAVPGPISGNGAARPAPRAIALFFDDTHIAEFGLSRAKIAAHKLAATGLHPGDRLGVFTDSGEVTLDLTGDAGSLATAIDRVKAHPQRGVTGVAVCPTLTPYQAYVIANHLDVMAFNIAVVEKIACDCQGGDEKCTRVQPAAVQSIAEDTWAAFRYQSTIPLEVLRLVVRALSHAPGQRILLMISPGFVTGGMERQTAAIADQAVRAHVVINALDSEGLAGPGESPDSKAPGHEAWAERTQGLRQTLITGLMADASAATGGRFVHNSNDLSGAVELLTTPPEISYLLGFSPGGNPDGKYHSLKLRLRDKTGYQVESRPGYFSARPDKQSESAQARIDRAAVSSGPMAGIPVAVRVVPTGETALRVDISVDAKGLKFVMKEGRSVQQVTFVTLLEDAAGNYIAGKQAVMDLILTVDTLARLKKDGIHAATSFTAPKGLYRIREIVREAVENRITASNTSFESR